MPRLPALALALAFAIAGCAESPDAPPAPAASATTDRDTVTAEMAEDTALREGDRAPDFELPDARGQLVRLNTLLLDGPVVLTFYRGAWCPYCNTQLRDFQAALPTIAAAGWGGDGADKNVVGLTDLTAFGFVPFVTHVHYDSTAERDELLASRRDVPIYAVPDGCAVQVEDEKIVSLGDVEIFD